MSYIAFDLDAINVARDVGAAAGLPEERITHGLLRMWVWCFREKTDAVTAIQVQGFFGSPAAAAALVAFGFLVAVGDTFRVRGADRYLRVSEARSKGGKAAAGNLKKGQKRATPQPGPQPELIPGCLPAAAGDQPELTPGCAPALTPNTEHLTPNVTTKAGADASRQPRETDALCADFREVIGSDYRWQSAKDGVAFASLRKANTLEEIRRRWRLGLSQPADKWLGVRTVAALASKWNDLAKAPAGGDWRAHQDYSQDFFGRDS